MMSEFEKDSLSLQETNKLRISLGLKPILDDTRATPLEEDLDQLACRNFTQKADQEGRQREKLEVKERLERAQTKRELARKLQGPTLSQPEPHQDTLQWLKGLKKKERANAAKRAQEIQQAEAQIQAEYGQADLTGLKVAHDLQDFEGEERILTLKDSRILDGEDDQLMDYKLEQTERDKLNLERKKGVKKYTGLEDDEAGYSAKRSVLSKYDSEMGHDDLNKGEHGGFRLGAGAKPTRQQQVRKEHEEAALASNKQLLSLDYAKNQDVSDYLQQGDVGFKKAKTKKSKAAKVKLDFDDQEPVAGPSNGNGEMEEPAIHVRKPRLTETDNFVDDDELQASLAKARRQKAKRTFNKMTPEMIAKNLAAQKEAERLAQANGAVKEQQGEGLTFDETTEFVRAINHRPTETAHRPRTATPAVAIKEKSVQPQFETVAEVPIKEQDPPDQEMTYQASTEEAAFNPLFEPIVSRGLASTLAVLRNQGMLPTVSCEEKRRERSQRDYDNWLATRRHEEHLRSLELKASKASGSSKDQATRELENRRREADLARTTTDRFKDYKPDFDIKYHDEFGRDLTPHEAWKQLSHVFHGKKPGAKKQEKRLKKIEEERKKEKMEAGDTPTGMIKAFQNRAERSGQAHMVLSVGNRGSAPQDLPLLGPNEVNLQQQKKGKARAKKVDQEEREETSTPVQMENGTESIQTPVEQSAPATTGGEWAAVGRSATPSMPQPTSNGDQAAQPKFKLAFGTKRKAEDKS